MSMVGAGKATIARITAERFGCKDEAMLQLIEKLAAADIVVGTPQFFLESKLLPDVPVVLGVESAYVQLTGTMDGKRFLLTLSGPAVEDFA